MAKARRRTNPASFDHIRRACEEFRAANARRGPHAKRAVAVVAKIENSLAAKCLAFCDCDEGCSDQVPCSNSKKKRKSKSK